MLLFFTAHHAQTVGRMLYESAIQKSAFPPDVLKRYQEAASKPRAMTSGLNYYRAIFRSALFNGFQRTIGPNDHISAPTLLIWGEQDIALGIELTQGLEQWVPNIQIERIPDSGHWVQQEKPERVNEVILEFLQK
jgi:pimeloyl-ACP methyl ester carboxylesterase